MKEYNLTDESMGVVHVKELQPLDSETQSIMKKEFQTGFTLSSIYYLFIVFIPIINWYFPQLAFAKIWGGMSFTWFLTTIVAMFLAYAIAHIHTALYERRIKSYGKTLTKSTVRKRSANLK